MEKREPHVLIGVVIILSGILAIETAKIIVSNLL